MVKKNDNGEDVAVTDIIVGQHAPAVDPGVTAQTSDSMSGVSPSDNRLKAFMLAKFPDRKYGDDIEFENSVADWAEEADEQLNGYKVADETIRKVAVEHPELLDIAKDLADDPKMPIQVAIMRNIDVDEFYPKEGDSDYDAMYKAREERMAKRAEQEAFQSQVEKNLEESEAIVRNYYKETGMDEAAAKALTDYADGIIGDYLDGKITTATLDMFRNAMNYDKDVAEAREVGKTHGMNANIDAMRIKKQEATDGLPKPGASTGTLLPPKAEEPEDVIDGVLKVTGKRRNW